MLKKLACQVFGCLPMLLVCFAAPATAQEPVLMDFYGSGVHSFYERDYMQAMDNLSQSIDGGSRDPRAYYYRGLAKMKSGDTYGAYTDLQIGADLESADVNGMYPVARSLERVQGAERKTLERYRAVARAQARQRQMRRDAVRYEERRASETRVLRAVPVGPPPAPLGIAPAPAPAPAAAVPAPAPPGAQPPVPPTPADEVPATDTDSPFDDPAEAAPAAEAPAEAPAAEPDPFAPAEGAPAAEAPAAAPGAETPPAAEDDPFADDPK